MTVTNRNINELLFIFILSSINNGSSIRDISVFVAVQVKLELVLSDLDIGPYSREAERNTCLVLVLEVLSPHELLLQLNILQY